MEKQAGALFVNPITESCADYSVLACEFAIQGNGADPMRTTTIAAVTTVVLAFLIVAHSRTVGLTEVTGSPSQNTLSVYGLDVGNPNIKNLPVQEIPLP